jgi:uncharacterized oxidoreductase
MKISGNTVFIAGGTAGIGLGMALRFQDAGNTVIVGGRNRNALAQIAAEHSGITTVAIDTSNPESISAAATELTTRFPYLNVLVTMAGIMVPELVRAPDFVQTAEATVITNLLGPIRLVGAFVEQLAAQPDATILTVSSGLAFVPLPLTPVYSATKAAIHSLSRGLRVQLADTSVQLIEIVPPAVRTALMGQQNTETAMPLEEYLDETMALLASQPDAEEILVEGVKFLRDAEVNGTYPQVLAMLSSRLKR